MAFRLSARTALGGIRRMSSNVTYIPRPVAPRIQQAIGQETYLPNADPSATSRSADMTNTHSDFMVPTYSRPPVVFVKGEGSYLWDLEDRKYLDFTSGIAVTGLGHSDPQIARIISEQASTLMHASNLYYNNWTGALSQSLVVKTRDSGAMYDAGYVFVCNSGSEANEAAIKFARKVGKYIDPRGAKNEIVSFNGAFHGRTMGSLSATPNPKYQTPFSPMVPGFKVGKFNDIEGIDELITRNTCGVIVEPIQGEGGINVAYDEFLIALGQKCRSMGVVLIYDEIQCGLSRTGSFWAHGRLPKDAHPDIITTAKALGNGFPIGATIVNNFVNDKIKVGDHGTTYGGNPMACRVAHHVVERLSDETLLKDVAAKGVLLRQGFERLAQKYPVLIKEIRGRGMLLGIQLDRDPTQIIKAARERGLLLITCGSDTLRIVPPLTISEDEIQSGLEILDQAITWSL